MLFLRTNRGYTNRAETCVGFPGPRVRHVTIWIWNATFSDKNCLGRIPGFSNYKVELGSS